METIAAEKKEVYVSTITFADEPRVKEAKPRYKSTITAHLIVKCDHCEEVFRFTGMDNKVLWDFRYSHAESCAAFQEFKQIYIDDHSEDEFTRKRVDLIGSAIGGSRVRHKDKPEHLLTQCGPRCREAKGTSCDCRCGGEQHGVVHQRQFKSARPKLVLEGAQPR